jgi:hypothetical protein
LLELAIKNLKTIKEELGEKLDKIVMYFISEYEF